jgi:predicted phage baseplate assembly protein
MTLATPSLDDRRFQDIVDDAKRLIPTLCPEWTNHNLSDPGVALIELFAWMTDLTLYRINQLPERLYIRFLELMGIELYGPRSARAELTFWLTSPDADGVLVPSGTEVAAAGREGDDAVVFMTEENLHVGQPRLVGCLTADGRSAGRFTDCWSDLEYGHADITCFKSVPPSPGDSFYLGFASSLAGNVIRLDITVDDIHGVGVDPKRPPLRWEVWSGEAWIQARCRSDDTGGLNRSGAVVLTIPRHHTHLALGDGSSGRRSAWWLRVSLQQPVPGQPTYSTSPKIQDVNVASLGGVVDAQHARFIGAEKLGVSDGTSGQRFTLQHPPVLPRRSGEFVRVIADGEETDWKEVEDFSRSGPQDPHFVCEWSTGDVSFGPRIHYPDGTRQRGAVPLAGAEIFMSGYRHGGGEKGNVDQGTLSVLRTTIPYIERVENFSAATGGRDAETVDNAKRRGPLTLRAGRRAVTAADYAHLALEATPSVARARCLPPVAAGGPIRLLIVPHIQNKVGELRLDDLGVDEELAAELHAYLDERCLLGTTFDVSTPYYQGVSITALVRGRSGLSPKVVEQRVLDRLHEYVSPFTGGFDGGGWPFDTDMNAGALVQLIGGVDGVEKVSEVVLFEVDLRNQRRLNRGVDVIHLEPESLFLSFQHQVVVR